MTKFIGEEIMRLRTQLEAAESRVAYLEGALVEIRRRDLRYYGTVTDDRWAYDGPIGAFVAEILETAVVEAETASSSLYSK
jgi:hypothetical protein